MRSSGTVSGLSIQSVLAHYCLLFITALVYVQLITACLPAARVLSLTEKGDEEKDGDGTPAGGRELYTKVSTENGSSSKPAVPE